MAVAIVVLGALTRFVFRDRIWSVPVPGRTDLLCLFNLTKFEIVPLETLSEYIMEVS